jgi:hypothetical protein
MGTLCAQAIRLQPTHRGEIPGRTPARQNDRAATAPTPDYGSSSCGSCVIKSAAGRSPADAHRLLRERLAAGAALTNTKSGNKNKLLVLLAEQDRYAMIGLLISGVCGLARCAQLRPPAASSRAVRLPLVLTGNPRNRPEAMLTDPRASPPPISCAC